MNKKPLYIPPDKREFGLRVYCSAKGCDSLMLEKCKLSGKSLQLCKEGKHQFKVIAYEQLSGKRKTKTLTGVEDLKIALVQAALFQHQVKEGKREVKQPGEGLTTQKENTIHPWGLFTSYK